MDSWARSTADGKDWSGCKKVGDGSFDEAGYASAAMDTLVKAEIGQPGHSLSRSWIRATTLGWLVGLVLVVVLAAAWDTMGGEAQFMVGAGIGAGVGYMQARVVRAWAGRSQAWFWASTMGMGMPFVLWDVVSAAGVKAFFSLPVCVLLGGLLTGGLQQRLLRSQFERTAWWIVSCGVGWGLPAGIIALGDSGHLPPAFGFLSTIIIFLGGLIVGAVTGKTLQWMPLRERSSQTG